MEQTCASAAPKVTDTPSARCFIPFDLCSRASAVIRLILCSMKIFDTGMCFVLTTTCSWSKLLMVIFLRQSLAEK